MPVICALALLAHSPPATARSASRADHPPRPILVDLLFPPGTQLAVSQVSPVDPTLGLRISPDSGDVIDITHGEFSFMSDSSHRMVHVRTLLGRGTLRVAETTVPLPTDSAFSLSGRLVLDLDGVSVRFRRATVEAWGSVVRATWSPSTTTTAR